MARKDSRGADPEKFDSRTMAKRGDIRTAAKSTMGDADYSQGYPPNKNELLNTNFSGKRSKGSKD